MAANALVGSHLVYCNSLFRGLSALDLSKLQCVQNSLARIIANSTKYSHITPVRKALHWLPIKYRYIFKTAVLVYKFLHSGNPKYFEAFLIPRHSAYNTHRSQSEGIFLEVPHFASVFKSPVVVVCCLLELVVSLPPPPPRWLLNMLCRTTHVNTMSLTTLGLCSMVVNSTLNLLVKISKAFSTTLRPLDILQLAILSSLVSCFLLYGLTNHGMRAKVSSPKRK